MKQEPDAGRCLLQKAVESGILDLVTSATLHTQQQNARVTVTEVLAWRKDIAALDFVEKAVFHEEFQGTVDCRRRDLFPFDFGQFFDDRVGARGGLGSPRGSRAPGAATE